jgi:hypothetical protein
MRSLPITLALLASPALAHVAPSGDSNNRYLKATLLPDEVRVTFTIFYGERPGVIERRRADANGDGRIDEAEARKLGERVLAELAPSLFVTVDGRAANGWKVADVGLGTPSVGAGALSVDLGLAAPYPDPRAAQHTLVLEDATEVPLPGESETRVEESPGVRVAECHLPNAAGGLQLVFPFSGNATGRGAREVQAKFSVDADLLPRPPARSRPLWPWALLGVAALAAAALLLRRRTLSGRYTGS